MQPENTPIQTAAPKLLDQVRDKIRVKHYSIRTETQYIHWVKRFILYHNKRHPREMGAQEVESFLTHLATAAGVSAATQNQALSALLFLYREILAVDLPWLDNVVRAKKPQRLPMVLSKNEVGKILARMDGTYALMAQLLYGTGMRLMECCRLRVKDIDSERREILIRDGKGAKDRVTMLPESLFSCCTSILSSVGTFIMRMIWQRGWSRCFCRMHSPGNTRMRPAIGPGNMYFVPAVIR